MFPPSGHVAILAEKMAGSVIRKLCKRYKEKLASRGLAQEYSL